MAIDPDDLQTCLRVIAEVGELGVEDPNSVAVRRATAGLFKTVKELRRSERREAILAADAAVTAATATGAAAAATAMSFASCRCANETALAIRGGEKLSMSMFTMIERMGMAASGRKSG